MTTDIILIFESILYILQTSWEVIKVWWWLVLPFLVWGFLKYHYLYFIQEKYSETVKTVLIEVKMPKQVIKPVKAMEHVFAGFHGIFHSSPPNWREKWIDGEYQLDLTLEIVSIGGKIHFYIRLPEKFRDSVESSIYSQYPDTEISLVDDYTKKVPQDIPNKDWDIWGADFINIKDDAYPIRTYKEFEVETEKDEEKKIDPLSIFLEGMAALNLGEQIWLQIKIKPVLGGDNSYQERGKELINKIARRPGKPKIKPLLEESVEIIVQGPQNQESKDKVDSPELKITPGEKAIITAIEEKLSKFGFESSIRFVYLAKRDVFSKARVATIASFFKEISSENMGGLKPGSTKTTVKSVFFWFLDKRRLYLRQRRIFRYYVGRFSPLFPRPGMTFVLNIEELATLFHFPSEMTISTLAVSRAETRKREAPFNLPVEE